MREQQEYVQLPSGLIVAEDLAEDYFEQFRRPVAMNLFCGCGGFSCGITEAGFNVIAAADSDTSATVTYLVNLGAKQPKIHCLTPSDEQRLEQAIEKEWKRTAGKLERICVSGSGWISRKDSSVRGCEHFFFGDVRGLTGKMILDAIGIERGEVDLVVGYPPCQGFSRAGKREVMDPRNSLVFDFARLVCEIQPKTMAFENVPGIISMVTPEGIPVMDAFARILEDGHMGTYNALRTSLTHNTDARAVVRRRPSAKEEQQQPEMPLFDEVAA